MAQSNREAVARFIAPEAWAKLDKLQRLYPTLPGEAFTVSEAIKESLEKADQILGLWD